ncbi:hypothetical protein [Paenibacillus mendelii]|uniref:Uncharacterized protein n=1 Tax=Paenibacillus mendelii TaxID=206163 RepID=A0ABV6J499_9BACL|nr:hypothetical protein [Paenibacillus mendelii]MCQ6561787.1 hypothetical protein [Paenibacillus mendelii]
MPGALLTIALFVFGSFLVSLQQANTEMSIFLLILSSVFALYALVIYNDGKRSLELREWMLANIDSIRRDGLSYNGVFIDAPTEFMQYELCFSWVVVTSRTKTAYYVKEYHPTPLLNLLFTGFTCLFGWWALPRGPFEALHAIGTNLSAKPKL